MKQRRKPSKSVIMFLDQAFGTPRLVRGRRSVSLAGIDLALGTAEALELLEEAGTQALLILPESLPRQAVQVLEQFLPRVHAIIPSEENLSKTLDACARRLRVDLRQVIFVAADRLARGVAAARGSLALPHATLAALLVRRGSVHFVRAAGDRERFHRIPDIIPYFAEYTERGAWSLLAATSVDAIAEMARRRLRVETLPLDLATEDPLFVQLDDIDEGVTAELTGQKVLFADGPRVLVAVGPDQPNDGLAIHGPHGHFHFLTPSPELLSRAPYPSAAFRTACLALGRWPLSKISLTKVPIEARAADLVIQRCPSTPTSFQADVDRYSGVTSLDSSGLIASRHIQHPDNGRAVQALLTELEAIGYCAYTHSFMHAGMTLHNVIADLPGTGYFRLRPDLLERLRIVFLKHPMPEPPDPWIKAITRVVGPAWLKENEVDALSPLKARTEIESLLELRPWFPWWLRSCPLAGLGAELIVVGCHLDSTAARTPAYNPPVDPAPGCDDDASGIAATLAIARYLWNFRGKLTHTVRFCFFNAEEQGLVGSKAYAAMLKGAAAPLKAVVCTDMIGYNSDAERIFEIHAGYTDPTIRDLSVPIADSIAAWASSLGALAPAQVYKGTSSASGSDRNLYDGAINRSDHAAFHQQGYPAVVVSEDFFANFASEPGSDPNPNYHEADDTVIDSSYGSAIACALAVAVKDLAR